MSETLPISVIMSVYKEPTEWLCQSIDSILNQTFSDFEFIIICDNPAGHDNLALLRDYESKDERVKLIINEENIGLTKSLNRGLAIATGKYIARMDADDISKPTRFEKQYQYMESHPETIVLGTAIKYIGKGAWKKATDGMSFSDDEIRAHMLIDNCIAHPTAFIRKSVLDDHEIKYDETYRHSQDFRLWELMWPYGEFANLKEKLLLYRLSEQQITKSSTSSQANLSDSVKIRLQKKWLDSLGYDYSTELIAKTPFEILEELRNKDEIKRSSSYSAFVQNAYLYAPCTNKKKLLFKKKDFLYITMLNLVRILIK